MISFANIRSKKKRPSLGTSNLQETLTVSVHLRDVEQAFNRLFRRHTVERFLVAPAVQRGDSYADNECGFRSVAVTVEPSKMKRSLELKLRCALVGTRCALTNPAWELNDASERPIGAQLFERLHSHRPISTNTTALLAGTQTIETPSKSMAKAMASMRLRARATWPIPSTA